MRKKLLSVLVCMVLTVSAFGGCMAPDLSADADALQIAVVDKGFGTQFAYDLAAVYTAKTGQKVQVVMDTPQASAVYETIGLGAANEIDLYFGVAARIHDWVSQKGNYVPGYNPILTDLSDVYDAPATGYIESQANPDLTIKDIVNPSVYQSMQYFEDDVPYGIAWASDINGMLYNKTLWDQVNATLSQKLELPKTTTEMFALFDRIKLISNNKKPYAFKYGGQNDYLSFCAFFPWFAQYVGNDALENFYQGKDESGVYTPEIYRSQGRFEALTVLEKMLKPTNKYTNSSDYASHIFNAQTEFLEGDAFFTFNGSWLEREASVNFAPGEVDAGFFKLPVISAVVDKFPAVFSGTAEQKDAQLRAVLDYIDGEIANKPAILEGHDDVLAFISDSRNTSLTLGDHIAFVPSYSNKISEAKEFLKFMMSKEGQEIMLAGSVGNTCALVVDRTQFDYYNSPNCSFMTKTKLEIYFETTVFANTLPKYPMQVLGGISNLYPNRRLEAVFGNGSQSAQTFRNDEFGYFNQMWKTAMSLAGVRNN